MKSPKFLLDSLNGLSATLGVTLKLLYEASEAERQLPCEPRGFACQIDNLLARGATETALRELVVGHWAEHFIETTTAQSRQRTFAPALNNRFLARSNFALTDAGFALASNALPKQMAPPGGRHASKPRFDPHDRKLLLRDLLVKEFRQPSDVQQLILAAFEEEGWPGHIDDPLPPIQGIDPKKRLSDAIYRLNCRQIHRVLAFEGNGTGKGVKWRERRA